MFKFYILSNSISAVRYPDGTLAVGSIAEGVKHLVEVEKVPADEANRLVLDMQAKRHNMADFGVCGTCTFSMPVDVTDILAAIQNKAA